MEHLLVLAQTSQLSGDVLLFTHCKSHLLAIHEIKLIMHFLHCVLMCSDLSFFKIHFDMTSESVFVFKHDIILF